MEYLIYDKDDFEIRRSNISKNVYTLKLLIFINIIIIGTYINLPENNIHI